MFHPYRSQIASYNSCLLRQYPCYCNGRTVNQDPAPFSLLSSMALFIAGDSTLEITSFSWLDKCVSFDAFMSLMHDNCRLVSKRLRSFCCLYRSSVISLVIVIEDWYSRVLFFIGFAIPRPPNLTGRDITSRSMSEILRPTIAGIRVSLMASSRGENR